MAHNQIVVCIACGCDDNHACPGGCYWAAVMLEIGVGICSRCAERPVAELEAELLVNAIGAAL